MATNFFNQLPGFNKISFGLPKKDHTPSPPSTAGVYRPRRSISEVQRSKMEHQMSMSLINRGLLNPTGENNCFLNSAVQILWHIDVFRRSFRKVKGHTCIGKACIFCALKDLFTEFQHGGQSAIPPDTLRQAMAECYEEQHRFQLGLMDDAAECFEKILEQVHFHLTGSEDMDTCSAKHCLSHQKFALSILERTECVCGATSEPLSFVQFVHYVSSSAIVKEAQRYADTHNIAPPPQPPSTEEDKGQSSDSSPEHKPSAVIPEGQSSRKRLYSASQVHFGEILNKAGSFGEYRKCPEYEHCKNKIAVKRILLNCPDVVCLGMIWDSNQPSVDDIMSVVLSIGLTLELKDLFDRVFADSAQFNQYKLTALIAYYGRHYSTFCYHSKMHEWVYFDDARFRTVGSDWEDVCEEIRKAHYQPLLLVYTNPFGEEIDLSEAPKVITKVQLGHHDDNKNATPPLPSISEEQTKTENVESATIKDDPKLLGEGDKKKEEEVNKVVVGSETVQNSKIGSIDPMTLSLVPSKSMAPVIRHNQASATPTSQGAMPISEGKLVTPPIAGGKGDLMSFSISPGFIEEMIGGGGGGGGKGRNGPPSPKASTTAATTQSGHYLERHPVVGNSDGRGGDLIEFSLSPSYLSKLHGGGGTTHQSAASTTWQGGLQAPNRRSPSPIRGGDAASTAWQGGLQAPNRGSPSPIRGGDATSTAWQGGLQASNRGSPSPIRGGDATSTAWQGGLQSHSPTMQHHVVPNRGSPSPIRAGNGGGGGSDNTPIRPNWDHYSNQDGRPVVVAPQKLISTSSTTTAAKRGGVSGDRHGNNINKDQLHRRHNRGNNEERMENIWTMMTKIDSPSSSEQPEKNASPAVLQLKRIASLPRGDDASSTIVGVTDTAIGEFELGDLSVGADELWKRKFASLPPTPDDLDPWTIEGAPNNQGNKGGRSKKSVSPQLKTTLLDDLEYAFPHADRMFDNVPASRPPQNTKDLDFAELNLVPPTSTRVGVATTNKSQRDAKDLALPTSTRVGVAKTNRSQHNSRDLDYVQLDLAPHTSNKEGVAKKQTLVISKETAGNVDYAEIRIEGVEKEAGHQGQKVKDGILIDVTANPLKTTPTRAQGGVASNTSGGDTQGLRHRDRPIGLDPLYAVPDKTKRGVASGEAPPLPVSRNTNTPIGMDPDYATPDKSRLKQAHSTSGCVASMSGRQPQALLSDNFAQRMEFDSRHANERNVESKGLTGGSPSMVRSHDTNTRSHDTNTRSHDTSMSTTIASLPSSVREKLEKAQNLFAQGDASTGSDNTVAMMLYQQFSNILFQVLQDSTVKASPTLYQQIKARREEGIRRCQSLQKKAPTTSSAAATTTSASIDATISTSARQEGCCKRCGRKRNLDDEHLCGPCQLRERMNRK